MEEFLNLDEAYDTFLHDSDKMSFLDDATSSIVVGRAQYHMDHLLVTDVMYCIEWVRCHVERGYGNLTPCGSTLWVRVKSDMPFITVLYSLMRRRLVENILLVVRRICALWPVCVTIFYWSSDLTFYDILRCHCLMLAWTVVYCSVLHLVLDSTWIWYESVQWNWERYLLAVQRQRLLRRWLCLFRLIVCVLRALHSLCPRVLRVCWKQHCVLRIVSCARTSVYGMLI